MTQTGQNTPVAPAKRIQWNFDADAPLLAYRNVHTVCEESRCPNRHECSSLGVATFLIGGRECTRSCKFCHIATAKPLALSSIAEKERADILEAARAGKYEYLVITSVARDDDEEGLAQHFAQLTRDLGAMGVTVELLIPDFHLSHELLSMIAESGPAVIAHNMETVKRLSPSIRPQARYERSLDIFRFLAERHPQVIRKSGFMVGLGETDEEVSDLLTDMKAAQIDIVSIGQYLQPSAEQATVVKKYTTDEFTNLDARVATLGFLAQEVGAFVRSSYMARETMVKLNAERKRRNHV